MLGCWEALKTLVADDSMSIALLILFLLCISGQAATGWSAYNRDLAQAHLAALPFGAFLRTGYFLDGVFSNWQAALLQLSVLVSFGSVLRQRGAAHSRKEKPSSHRKLKLKLRPRHTLGEWLYANSLSLALILLFLICFSLHLLFGHWKYAEEQALRHLPGVSLWRYARSAAFWSSALECWEAEFGAIGLYILFSIFLRQEHSPESKPVEARNDETGKTND